MATYKNKLWLILLLFFISFCGFSQAKPTTQTIEVYNYDKNGFKEISPTKIIEIKEDKVEVYETTFGVKNITPTQIIQDNKLYETKDGIQELFPRQSWNGDIIPPTIESNSVPIFNLPVLPFDF